MEEKLTSLLNHMGILPLVSSSRGSEINIDFYSVSIKVQLVNSICISIVLFMEKKFNVKRFGCLETPQLFSSLLTQLSRG